MLMNISESCTGTKAQGLFIIYYRKMFLHKESITAKEDLEKKRFLRANPLLINTLKGERNNLS